VIHFNSHPEENLLDVFNKEVNREFYTNNDYERVGGRKDGSEEDEQEQERESDYTNYQLSTDGIFDKLLTKKTRDSLKQS